MSRPALDLVRIEIEKVPRFVPVRVRTLPEPRQLDPRLFPLITCLQILDIRTGSLIHGQLQKGPAIGPQTRPNLGNNILD